MIDRRWADFELHENSSVWRGVSQGREGLRTRSDPADTPFPNAVSPAPKFVRPKPHLVKAGPNLVEPTPNIAEPAPNLVEPGFAEPLPDLVGRTPGLAEAVKFAHIRPILAAEDSFG